MARDFADKSAVRQWVWDRLVAEGVARFPFPPHGRIPNFAGAEVAAARLLDIEPWKSATAIKINPDSPQRPLRAEALRRGITVFVPTPSLRGGFKKLDPRRVPPDKIEEATSLVARQPLVRGGGLAEMPELDAIVCGSDAVTRDGWQRRRRQRHRCIRRRSASRPSGVKIAAIRTASRRCRRLS